MGDGILLKVTPVSQNIALSSSIRSIVGGAFESAGIEQITLPASVTVIPDYAFSGCTNLSEVIFRGTITSVGSRAFTGCTKLESVSIPSGAAVADDAYVNSGLDQ